MPTQAEYSKTQALYLKELYTVAEQIYKRKTAGSPNPFPIDPQGRVILDVRLDDAAWERIYFAEHPEKDGDQENIVKELVRFKQEFKAKLGHPVQEMTSVSLDLQTQSNEQAFATLSASLGKYLPQKNKDRILEAYQGLAKGRIISLQQETHFHMHLIGRMLKTAVHKGESELQRNKREDLFGNTEQQFQKGINNALLILNKEVMLLHGKALTKAFAEAKRGNTVNQEKFATILNKELDDARKKLLPSLAKVIRKEVIRATGIQFDKSITKHLSKHLAEATSASLNDFLHIDRGTGFISFIGASEHTSHHQDLGGAHLADRIMYSHHLKEDGAVVPLSHRQHVRVPSIAIKQLHSVTKELLEHEVTNKNLIVLKADGVVQGKIKEFQPEGNLSEEEQQQVLNEYQKINVLLINEYGHVPYTPERIAWAFNKLIVNDTIEKFVHLQNKYNLGGDARLKEKSEIPHAFIYNLYTTLNKHNKAGKYDESRNKQSQSAEHILVAAHLYNRKNPEKPLCLVQNMSVNGWGHELSLKEDNSLLVNEATLMTEMASLHTIYDSLLPKDQKLVRELFGEYRNFIGTENTYFYNYIKATKSTALATLKQLKEGMSVPATVDSTSVVDVEPHRVAFAVNAKAALVALYKEGAFGHHQNGFTYQALSVFVEQSSLGGCKSANERAQAVNGRISILDFVSLDTATRDDLLNKFLSAHEAQRLTALANQLEKSIHEKNCVALRQNMDDLYASLNLEGFQAVISFIDQGGHAKLGTKGFIPDTNESETVKTHVKNASKWQCHKGLSENVLKEFCGILKVDYVKELKPAAKAIGIVATVAGLGALGSYAGTAIAATFFAVSVAFPPIGIAIAIGAALVAAAILVVSLARLAYKVYQASDYKTNARFEKIQQDNSNLIEQESEQIKQRNAKNFDLGSGHKDEEVVKPVLHEKLDAGTWRRSKSSPNLLDSSIFSEKQATSLKRSLSVGDMRATGDSEQDELVNDDVRKQSNFI